MTEISNAAGSWMKVSTPGQKHLLIVGATGMVGGYALRYGLDHPAVGSVTSIGRRKLGISHPKLKEVLHQNFADCSALAGELSVQDAAVFCLGSAFRYRRCGQARGAGHRLRENLSIIASASSEPGIHRHIHGSFRRRRDHVLPCFRFEEE
jgi:hypothetical protein